jgi:1,5-anhydro-D-fructose reductase (1,5-anhydro-D-mannitol-forming)
VSRAIRWALVGASDIAATRILPAMHRLGHKPVVVVSADPGRAASYARQHGIASGTASLSEALESDVDAVYISTRNELHAPQTHAAVAAGRHVLCEKPLALSLHDAQAMVDAAAEAGVVMGTNHHLRSAPVHRTLHRLVADGAVGTPLAIRVAHAIGLSERLRGWRVGATPGSGVVLDLTVHDADTVRFVTGLEPIEVAAIGLAQGLAQGSLDAVAVAGRLEGDVTLHLHDAYTVPHSRTGFEVHGTEGSLLATDAMTQQPDGDVLLRRGGRDDMLVDIPDREDLYERALRTFAAAVDGDGAPAATGVDGVRSLAVALAVQESVVTGRRVTVDRGARQLRPGVAGRTATPQAAERATA